MTSDPIPPRAGARAVPSEAGHVVLFDFDGVIVRGDAFTRFVKARYRRSAWRLLALLPVAPALAALATTRAGRPRAERLAILGAFAGVRAARYRALAHAFGTAFARDSRNIRREACTALSAHRHAGARVLVVTGCEEVLARAILDGLGFAEVELVASRIDTSRGGLRIALRNRGFEKARQLGLRGVRPPWNVVYSDSAEDLPLLAAARSAVLVNPDRATLARVSARLGKRLTIVDWA